MDPQPRRLYRDDSAPVLRPGPAQAFDLLTRIAGSIQEGGWVSASVYVPPGLWRQNEAVSSVAAKVLRAACLAP